MNIFKNIIKNVSSIFKRDKKEIYAPLMPEQEFKDGQQLFNHVGDLMTLNETGYYFYSNVLLMPIQRLLALQDALAYFQCGVNEEWLREKVETAIRQYDENKGGELYVTLKKIQTQMLTKYNKESLDTCLALFFILPNENPFEIHDEEFKAKKEQIKKSAHYQELASFFLTKMLDFSEESKKITLNYLEELEKVHWKKMLKILD